MKLDYRGVWRPVLAVAMTACLAAHSTFAADKAGAASEKLPPARQIIDRFVKEVGGEAAFSKIESQHATGFFEMPAQGVKGRLEVYAKRPDSMLVKINFPGLGDIEQGYNGDVGWSRNPATGPMLLEGDMLEQMKEQADFDAMLHRDEDYKSMETVKLTEFDGKQAYEIKLIKPNGRETSEYYSKDNGLLLGFVGKQSSPLGDVEVHNVLSEYKKFGGVLFATKIKQKVGPLEQELILDKIVINSVKDVVFELPREIKAMVDAK